MFLVQLKNLSQRDDRKNMKKYIVITSIFEPSGAVKKFNALKDWQLVVVGDKKTPESWKLPGAVYLSPAAQKRLPYRLARLLPWNHYSRKMLGYLYALEHGADVIASVDDDNIPEINWADGIPAFSGTFATATNPGFINPYTFFTDKMIWPRGFPLSRINKDKGVKVQQEKARIGIWQMLSDEDPDVDAVYRLTSNAPVFFNKKQVPLVLSSGTVAPFNTQNTATLRLVSPLLYLPTTVTFRFTDILSSLCAQAPMWHAGYRLGFATSNTRQERNPHDYLRDFESEIPMYLHGEKAASIAQEVTRPDYTIEQNLLKIYIALAKERIVDKKELPVLKAWLSDIKDILGRP